MDRILIKHGKAIVGRLLLPVNVLLLADERDRWAVARFLEEQGHPVQAPAHGWQDVPAHAAYVEHVGVWGAWKVTLGATSSDEEVLVPESGLYFAKEKVLFSGAPEWDAALAAVLDWHGLPVTAVTTTIPAGHDPKLAGKITASVDLWKFMQSSAADLSFRARWGATTTPVPVVDARALSPARRALVPDTVADAVDEWFACDPHDRYNPTSPGHLWWAWRAAAFTDEHVDLLTELVAPLPLPPTTQTALRWAGQISPDHVLALAALRLRELEPQWWADLPWRDLTLETPSLQILNAAQRRSSGQPELAKAIKDQRLPLPDFPKGLDELNDGARLFIAAAALAHTGAGRTSVDYFARATCLVCQREYLRAGHPLVTLLAVRSARICCVCADAARLYTNDGFGAAAGRGRPYRWSEARIDGVLDALRTFTADGGGPPAHSRLASHLDWDSEEELVRQVLLRIPLPNFGDRSPGNPKLSWSEWLTAANVLDGWRPSYGTYSVATDGHPCRSLFERHIDDWLHAHRIDHDIEPQYPYDPDLNPNTMRADWSIEGTYIEAAGLMSSDTYAAKIGTKEQLAKKHGIDLIVVGAHDLGRLDTIFRRWLPSS